MSNIFDALNKRHPEKARTREAEPLVPIEPRQVSGAGLAPPSDAVRDVEMERLRQRVLLELGTNVPGASVLFAGSVEGEGATTLALLFSRELALAEQRPVLLVDADIEGYPRTLTGTMRGEAGLGVGFTDLLLGRAQLSDGLLGTELPNLHFLPRGTELGAALDLVQTKRVRSVLDEIQRHYAFVILDGAPLVDSPESSLVAAATDGVVVVVRANRTRREIVQRGLRLLQQANCQVLGAVLNERRYPIPTFIYRRL